MESKTGAELRATITDLQMRQGLLLSEYHSLIDCVNLVISFSPTPDVIKSALGNLVQRMNSCKALFDEPCASAYWNTILHTRKGYASVKQDRDRERDLRIELEKELRQLRGEK